MELKKKMRKMLNIHNIEIFICVIIIIVSLIIIIMPENDDVKTVDGVKVVQGSTDEDEEISEEDAIKLAVKQFKELNEKTDADELNVRKIKRNEEEYYYITSSNNSLEIKIKGGEITRINTVLVEE